MTLRLANEGFDNLSLCNGWREGSFKIGSKTSSDDHKRRYSTGNLIVQPDHCSGQEQSDDDTEELRLEFVTLELSSEQQAVTSVPEAPQPRRHTVQGEIQNAEHGHYRERSTPRLVKCTNPWESIERRRRRRRKRGLKWTRRPRKIVVVGDMSCGKTSLVSAYCKDQFPELYMPTIMRCESSEASINGITVSIIVSDTPGRHDYSALRKCAYHKADIVLICCALDCPRGLEGVRDFWVPEVRRLANGVPYMLVGTRSDAREELTTDVHQSRDVCTCTRHFKCTCSELPRSNTNHIVTTQQGIEISEEIGALDYMECSARYRDGTRRVFEQATLFALRKHRRKRKLTSSDPDNCTIL